MVDPTARRRIHRRDPDQRRQDRRLRARPVRLGAPYGIEVVDCRGLFWRPGLVDMRVHAGEPGEEHKETMESAGIAAVGRRHHLDGAAAQQRAAVRRRLAGRVRRPARARSQAGQHVRLRRAHRRPGGQGAGRDGPAGRGRRGRLHRRRPRRRQRPGDAARAVLRQGLRRADRPAAAGADAVGRRHDQRR